MQNNQVKVKKKMRSWWGGGGLKTNGQSMKESKSHIRHCFRFFLHYLIISLKNVCSYLQGVIGGIKAEGKVRKFSNRISRVYFLSLATVKMSMGHYTHLR